MTLRVRVLAVLAGAGAACALAAAAAVGAPALTPEDRAAALTALVEADAPVGTDEAANWEALVRLERAELGQGLDPRSIDPDWAIVPPPRQVEAEMTAAGEQGRLAAWLATAGPVDPRYAALKAARRRYARISAAGGWAPLPPGPDLHPGQTAPAVAALRTRLAAEGFVDPAAVEPDRFDAILEQGLAAFQRTHGLKGDGVLRAETRAQLDVSAAERLVQIDANLQRWRWAQTLPPYRVEVDIAAAEAVLVRPDGPPLPMRAIVGDRRHHSPSFASRIEGMVLNPPWIVPASIARQELLPKELANPGYLARNGFHLEGETLKQAPGPKNSLGRLKFDLPSPFGVYLHDTPARAAFARSVRMLSHGCIRLEKPRELAAALLADQGWTPEAIDAAIDAGATVRIALAKPVPVYLVYSTVVAGPDGSAQFRRDVYGWDARLAKAVTP